VLELVLESAEPEESAASNIQEHGLVPTDQLREPQDMHYHSACHPYRKK